MPDCPMCGGEVVEGTCRNCGTPTAPRSAVASPVPHPTVDDGPLEPVPLPEITADLEMAAAGIAEIIAAAGDDPGRPELVDTPTTAVRAILAITRGYDTDPGAAFDGAPLSSVPAGNRVTLSASVPMRTACERCMMPIFGEVDVRCETRDRHIDGSHLVRLVGILSTRLQNEGQLAEQVAAAVVEMGGASSASARVTARRPCDECGAGRTVTTGRARRTAPAGGDTPQTGGG